MNISELIKELQKVQKNHGDVQVNVFKAGSPRKVIVVNAVVPCGPKPLAKADSVLLMHDFKI